MKRLLLSVLIAGFAVAVQAGGDGTCCEKSGSCCAAKNASVETNAECPMAKQAKVAKAGTVKQVSFKQASAKQVLKSPKATG